MVLALADVLAKLDQYSERIPLDRLTDLLRDIEIRLDDVEQFVRFGADTYQRNLMHDGKVYQALVLCWRAGQRSPIHDHTGSTCGVRVLAGAASETLFKRNAAGLIYATSTRHLSEGAVCGSQDSDIHQVSNLQDDGEDLITLHIYSPPLLLMNIYSLTDDSITQFHDPVHGFMNGDGI